MKFIDTLCMGIPYINVLEQPESAEPQLNVMVPQLTGWLPHLNVSVPQLNTAQHQIKCHLLRICISRQLIPLKGFQLTSAFMRTTIGTTFLFGI